MDFLIKNNDYVGKRIDIVIPILDNSLTRSRVDNLIKENFIKVNGQNVKANYCLKLKDLISIDRIDLITTLEAENIPLDIVYEDDDLLVINKPRGLVVHPGNGNEKHTLANALLFHFKNLSQIDKSRPGIVHRIDKDTSGLLVVAKNDLTHLALSKQLKDHTMHREYFALVSGLINEDKGTIIAPIGRDKSNPIKMAVDIKNGKEAETYFEVIERLNNSTLVKVKLKQGRTHQIRVHFDYIHHPVIGDSLYGKGNRTIIKDGQILHAYRISFIHPKTNKIMTFEIKFPQYFENAIKLFR